MLNPFRFAPGYPAGLEISPRCLSEAGWSDVSSSLTEPPPNGRRGDLGNLPRNPAVDERREHLRPDLALNPTDPVDDHAQGRVTVLQMGDFDRTVLKMRPIEDSRRYRTETSGYRAFSGN